MWISFALAMAMTSALAQSDQLTISNVRATYDFLGPNRPDDKILPGDKYTVAFDVDGLKTEPDGKVSFSMAMDLTDPSGKVVYSQPAKDQEAYLSLGGSRATNSVWFYTRPDGKSGKYTVKVTVADKASKASRSFTREYEILPKDFGIVQLFTTADPDARVPAPLSGITGQFLHVNFAVVGFERNKGSNQPDVRAEMRVLDEKGKPTLEKAVEGRINEKVPSDILLLPMQFHLALNRPGKFTIELKALDSAAGKTAKKIRLPLTVVEQKPPVE